MAEPRLSPETELRVKALFPPETWSEVTDLLARECGNNLPFLHDLDEYKLERFRFAALKLSGGQIDKLKEAIALAKADWRDLLVAAGFASSVDAHRQWFPGQS